MGIRFTKLRWLGFIIQHVFKRCQKSDLGFKLGVQAHNFLTTLRHYLPANKKIIDITIQYDENYCCVCGFILQFRDLRGN
jgi:hypothetical protein